MMPLIASADTAKAAGVVEHSQLTGGAIRLALTSRLVRRLTPRKELGCKFFPDSLHRLAFHNCAETLGSNIPDSQPSGKYAGIYPPFWIYGCSRRRTLTAQGINWPRRFVVCCATANTTDSINRYIGDAECAKHLFGFCYLLLRQYLDQTDAQWKRTT
jgi:hypothetical protein